MVKIQAVFEEIGEFLVNHGLDSTLGLQVINHDVTHDLVELETDDGETLTFRREDIGNEQDWRVTNWLVCVRDEIIELKGNEQHASKPGGPHMKFVDGKIVQA